MRIALAAIFLLNLGPGWAASAADKKASSPYSILHAEWKARKDAIRAEPADPGSEIAKQKQLALKKLYTGKFLKLAKEHPADDLWLNCLIWIGVEGTPGPDFDEMMEFMAHNAKSVENRFQLQLFMSELIPLESNRLNASLEAVTKDSVSDGVRGAALYALAARTKLQAERDGSIEDCRKARELLRTVIDKYPEVTTYRGKNKTNAEDLLEELQGPTAIGHAAPALKGTLLGGESFELAKYRGRVVVLSFSGHWCGPCRAMHPVEKAILKKYSRDQVVIVEINSDKKENISKVARKIAADGLDWHVIADGPDGKIAGDWKVSEWPTFCVLDQNHQIRRRATDDIGKKLADWVDQLVRESAK